MVPVLLTRAEVRTVLTAGAIELRRELRGPAKTAKGALRYGGPGDRLWGRERFATRRDGGTVRIRYTADGDKGEARVVPFDESKRRFASKTYRSWPSTHMPRWASRITLEVIETRAEEKGPAQVIIIRAKLVNLAIGGAGE